VNARAHPALKLLGVKGLYGNNTVTYDLRTGVQADASTLFTKIQALTFRGQWSDFFGVA
jgi:hypothetical protein